VKIGAALVIPKDGLRERLIERRDVAKAEVEKAEADLARLEEAERG
jgi:hypothetical protein